MNDIYKQMSGFIIDPNVIELKNYCYSFPFMEILRISRKEDVHSSFLAWLFDARYNYDLNNKPLELLLNLLIHEDLNNNISYVDKNNLFFKKDNIILNTVQRELPIGDNGRVDIFIEFSLMNEKYAIVIENKVEARENFETRDECEKIFQTDKYYDHFKEDKGTNYIYMFLSPTNVGDKVIANNKNFINVSYDDIVKGIIEPLLCNESLLEKTRLILEDYLKVLDKPIINKNNNESTRSMLSPEFYDYKNILITKVKKVREKYEDFGNLLQNNVKQHKSLSEDIEYEVLEDFINNNKQIIELIWPEITKQRDSIVTFAELGIPKGTILYLADKEHSDTRYQMPNGGNKVVTTFDDKTTVQYKLNGVLKTDVISTAAKELSEKDYGLRGISWFIYNDGNRDINLFKLNKEKEI